MKNTPQKNTLFNYFTSPSTKKLADTTPKKPPSTPKSSREQKDKAEKSTPVGKKREKSTTPETSKSRKAKDTKQFKGKENKNILDRKRFLDDDEDEDEDEVKDEISTPRTKKRKIIIPEDSEGDTEDEYQPDESVESDEYASEGTSESEPETEEESFEESPKKKRKVTRATAKTNQSTVKSTKTESKPAPQEQRTDSWRHLKIDFLQPDKIKDKNRRPPTDPNYDPRTLYVPQDFLNQQTPAMRQWWELKIDNFDCILFFKVGKFYELYHMDAVIGVEELNLTFMRGEFAHSGFPEIAYGRFSASLIEKGYRVARVEQTENPDMMAARCKKMSKPTKFDKVVKREICQISTKGTQVQSVQDMDTAAPTSNYLLSLIELKKHNQPTPIYGICFVDTTIGDFYLGQFEDDNCNSRLLTLLAHHPPVHVIYERGNLSSNTLKILNTYLPEAMKDPLQKESQFWSSSKVLNHLHEEQYFKQDNSDFVWPAGLQEYLNSSDSLGLTAAEDKEAAVNALGGCVYLLKSYLIDQQLLSQGRFKSYTPPDLTISSTSGYKFPSSMVLDAMTINNLKILSGEGSLIKKLDRCCTAFGKRLLRDWVCRPSCRKAVILQRQGAITELTDRPDIAQNVRSVLTTLPDLERLLSKIHTYGNAARMWNHPDGRAILFDAKVYSKKKIVDFISALDGFEQTLKIIEMFDECNNALINRCSKLEPEGDFPSLLETLNYFKEAFDHENAKKEGSILPKKGVDAEYDEVLNELDDIKNDSSAYLQKQQKHFGVQIKFFGSDRKRYQIEVPDSQLKKVGPGYELQSQRKGFKRYYTAEAKELLARQMNVEEKRDKILKDLNRRMFAKFSEKYEHWNKAVYNIAMLDVLLALAEYAREENACIPEIFDENSEDGKIFTDIREAKHPCIANDNFIPNDTVIATNDVASLIILTGPNMGGKSTLMRQVGLITIMAQIGCPVPATSCQLTLTDRIFTRLGASDDIMAGQSTFLVELSETAAILQHATPYSLVLLDELGRGTSTYDGTAIAASVVDALTKIKCRTLFSTHYHSLVEDYKKDTSVTLAHMACMVENDEEDEDAELSEEKVTFLYKFTNGACPKSYGFNAARLAGIPMTIIKKARQVATALEREVQQRHDFIALCKTNMDMLKHLTI